MSLEYIGMRLARRLFRKWYSFSLGEKVYDCWEVNAIVAHDRGLIPRPNKEIAHIHATRVRTTPTKTPFQVGALLLLHGPIKVERCLTGG